MGNIKVLDVTLRDGGCVNDFNFGQLYMNKILEAQEAAGIDIIELGYLDEKNGSLQNRTKFVNEKCIYESFLKTKVSGISYVAMMDYDKYNPEHLEERNESGLDGIRLAFHKKDYKCAIELGKKILSKGYDLYIQPMITLRYSDKELLDLVECVNADLPETKAFYIVDSFGEMRMNDVVRIWNILDHNINPNMTIGFHSHNNLQLSYANAMELLSLADNRNIILDSSIMGMGKGAGNLNTELLLEHLNLYKNKKYKIEPLLAVIDKVINQLHAEWRWGYAPEYYLSATNHCTPSYASYFYNKHMLPIDFVNELLGRISEEKKISFDAKYAEDLYKEFNSEKVVDDTDSVRQIKSEIENFEILLVAPGKTLIGNSDLLKKFEAKENVKVLCLNMCTETKPAYVITTREDIYQKMQETDNNIIVTSNICKGGRGNVHVLNYSNWIADDGKVRDASSVIALNLLKNCGVKKVYLAGFDGFSVDINSNYYDPYLRHQLTEKQVSEYNDFHRNLIKTCREEGMKIEFATPSKYE